MAASRNATEVVSGLNLDRRIFSHQWVVGHRQAGSASMRHEEGESKHAVFEVPNWLVEQAVTPVATFGIIKIVTYLLFYSVNRHDWVDVQDFANRLRDTWFDDPIVCILQPNRVFFLLNNVIDHPCLSAVQSESSSESKSDSSSSEDSTDSENQTDSDESTDGSRSSDSDVSLPEPSDYTSLLNSMNRTVFGRALPLRTPTNGNK